MFFLSIILLSSGDIRTNPSSTFPLNLSRDHIIKKNPKYSAGTQCNSLASVCYAANIKQVRYWTTWNLDKILDLGMKPTQVLVTLDKYLSFDDLRLTFSMCDKVQELQKSDTISGQNILSVQFLFEALILSLALISYGIPQ